MLRKEKKGEFVESGTFSIKYQFSAGKKISQTKLSKSKYNSLLQIQSLDPVKIMTDQEKGRTWWMYQDGFYIENEGGLLIARDIIIDENKDVVNDQYGHWKEFMKSQGEDPDFWYSEHIEKDYPMTLTDHFVWLRKAGFSKVACQWRLYNFAITTAEKKKI